MRSAGVALALALSMSWSCAPPPDPFQFDVSDAAVHDADVRVDAGGTSGEADWRRRPIYMVMTDRFANGDPTNDLFGDPDCFDPDGDRAFHGGDFAGLAGIRALDYLQQLGVGTVWMTPIYEQVGCGYHGYWADFRVPDPGGLEPKLGTDDDFRSLIDRLHDRDMRLMLDMIVNHSGRGATIVGQRPDWFHDADGCEKLGSSEVFCPLSGLPDFAHEQPEVSAYVTALSTSLLDKFAVDGIRMDTAKHVARDYFRDEWFPAVRAVRDLFIVAEVFDASGAGVYEEYYEAGFDSVFHFAVRQGLIDTFAKGASTNVLADRVKDSIDKLGLERATHATLFLDNHDVPRWSEESSASASETLKRYRLALAAMFTLPGIPQLYYGDELGFTGGWPHNRRSMPEWVWTAETRAGNHPEALPDPAGTFNYVRSLAMIRRDNPALWRGSYAELWRQNAGAAMYVYFRGYGDNRIIVVINNGGGAAEVSFRVSDSQSLSPSDRQALSDGTVLQELLGAGAPATMSIVDGRGVVTMPGRSLGIYRVTP